jgi:hypothetical protein
MQIECAELREQFTCTWGWCCYLRWWSKDAAEEEAKGLSAFPHVCHGHHHEVPPHVWAGWHGSVRVQVSFREGKEGPGEG